MKNQKLCYSSLNGDYDWTIDIELSLGKYPGWSVYMVFQWSSFWPE